MLNETSDVRSFEWKDQYHLGVELMDRDHKEIMQLAGALEAAVAANAGSEEILARLDAAIAISKSHMARENVLLKQAGYPSYRFHKGEHDDLMRALMEFRAKVVDGSATVSMSVIEFLAGWMSSHLRCEDRRAAEFLKQLAKTP